MREFSALVKAQIINQFAGKSGNMKKWVIYLILFVAFSPVLAGMAYSMYYFGWAAAEEQVLPEIFSVCLTMVQIVIVFMGLITLLTTVYFSTDNEMLLGLPLKPRTIFFSKLFIVYVNELLLCLIMSLAVFVPLGIGAGAGVLYYLFLPVVVLLLPLLPLLVATIISVPLMYAVSFFKRRAALSSVVGIGLFGLFFGVYMIAAGGSGSSDSSGNITDLPSLILSFIKTVAEAGRAVYPNFVFGSAVFADSAGSFFANFAITLGFIAALMLAAVFIANLCYNRSIALLESPRNQKNKELDLKEENNITLTLIKKDFLEVIKNPGVAFQCLLQLVLAPILMIVFVVSFGSMGPELGMFFDSKIIILVFAAVQVFFVIAMNMTSATSITRENRNFYMMKTMPVSYETQIMAKAYFGTLLNSIAVGISNLILLFAFSKGVTDVIYVLLGAAFLLILGHAFSMNTAGIDLKRPRLKWQTVSEGLKNNAAQLIGMAYSLLAMLVVGVVGGGFYYLYVITVNEIFIFIMWAVLIGLAALAMFLSKKSLLKNIDKKFEAIEE